MAELATPAPTHRVKVSVGFTRNMGDFESLRLDVGLEVDGKPGDTPTSTFEKAYAWAEKQLIDKLAEVQAEVESRK